MIEAGFKFGLGIVAAGVALCVGYCLLLALLENYLDGKK